MATDALFRSPYIGRLLKTFGAFPKAKYTSDRTAIRKTIELVEDL